ncbi:MAG TPA: hypothetical protein VK453_04145 [Micromonosporaceae bacterium]|nr:hypothetical protein [Micromonosporaceae bacterium]
MRYFHYDATPDAIDIRKLDRFFTLELFEVYLATPQSGPVAAPRGRPNHHLADSRSNYLRIIKTFFNRIRQLRADAVGLLSTVTRSSRKTSKNAGKLPRQPVPHVREAEPGTAHDGLPPRL